MPFQKSKRKTKQYFEIKVYEMKKLLLILCITMNLICMMLAVFLFMMRNSGLGIFINIDIGGGGGQSLDPTVLSVVFVILAVLFAYLATRLAVDVYCNEPCLHDGSGYGPGDENAGTGCIDVGHAGTAFYSRWSPDGFCSAVPILGCKSCIENEKEIRKTVEVYDGKLF